MGFAAWLQALAARFSQLQMWWQQHAWFQADQACSAMPHSSSPTNSYIISQSALTAACTVVETDKGRPYLFQPQAVELLDQEIWRLCPDHCSPARAQHHTAVTCTTAAHLHTLAWGRQGIACWHVKRRPAVLWALNCKTPEQALVQRAGQQIHTLKLLFLCAAGRSAKRVGSVQGKSKSSWRSASMARPG